MRVMGLDFTSAPTQSKPITCAVCTLAETTLRVERLERLSDFRAFERVLAQPGPYIAAIDFPFGQPPQLSAFHGWPKLWPDFVALVDRLGKVGFEEAIVAFRDAQPAGKKHPLRTVDRRADSCSPLMLSGVPVGKMFFQGAPRLLKSGASIIPCHPRPGDRVIFEAYPGVAVRTLMGGKLSYKSDEKSKQTPEKSEARKAIVARMGHPSGVKQHYGLDLELPPVLASTMYFDASGDTLDAVLCAVQAAWAHRMRDSNFGIPVGADSDEGWIPDPGLLTASR